MTSSGHDELEWKTNDVPNLVGVSPIDLTTSTPRLAKDIDYASAVQEAWKQEGVSGDTESTQVEYQDAEGTKLYGHIIRRRGTTPKVPGVLFFHTGAGPHDICLLWKADSLLSMFPEGCVIMIADILSDPTGWAWLPDRTRYNEERERLFASDEGNKRPLLQKRVQAAVQILQSIEGVDPTRMAAMGWCLGGYPVLETTRMRLPEIKAMATFHGVFRSVVPPMETTETTDLLGKILICNGEQDPFVGQSDLDSAIKVMESNGYQVTLLQLKGAKHGFTNPAQDFNPNENFRFNGPAAAKAWKAATDLLVTELK